MNRLRARAPTPPEKAAPSPAAPDLAASVDVGTDFETPVETSWFDGLEGHDTALQPGELESMLGGVDGDPDGAGWDAGVVNPELKVGFVDAEDPKSKSELSISTDSVKVGGPVGSIGAKDGQVDLGVKVGADEATGAKGMTIGGSIIYDRDIVASESRDDDGDLIGRGREHIARTGGVVRVDGPVAGASAGHVVQDKASAWVVAREDGSTPSDAAIDARVERIADRDAGESPEEIAASVGALLTDVASWEAGDSVGTDESSRTSIDAKLGKAVAVSAGVSGTDRTQRTVEALGDGKVRVTLTHTDGVEGRVGAEALKGLVSGSAEGVSEHTESQSVELDLATEQGQADFAILQYTGMLPGAAEALGITTPEEAAAFLAAGGMDAVAEGTWEVPAGSEEIVAGGADGLNEHLLEGAGDDARYVEVSEEDRTRTDARLGLLGFTVAGRETEGSHETIRRNGPDGEEVVVRNEETVRTEGWLLEDGAAYAGSVIDADGSYVLRTASSYEGAVADSETELAARMEANPALADAVDDPRTETTIAGDTGALVDGLKGAEIDAGDARTLAYLELRRITGMEMAPGEDLEAVAERAGMSVDELMAATHDTLVGLTHDPEAVAEMSPAVAEAYALLAIQGAGAAEGLDALAEIAEHASPEATAAAVAAALASGVDVTPALIAWAEENGIDLGVASTEAVAGSDAANDVIAAAAEGDVDVGAGERLLEDVAGLTSSPEDLALFLDGLDATAGIDDLMDALPAGMTGELLALAPEHEAVKAAASALLLTDPGALLPRDLLGDELTAWVEQNLGPLMPEGMDAAGLIAKAGTDTVGMYDPDTAAAMLGAAGMTPEELVAEYGSTMARTILERL